VEKIFIYNQSLRVLVKSLGIKRVLCLSILSFEFLLILNIHLKLIDFTSSNNSTTSHLIVKNNML